VTEDPLVADIAKIVIGALLGAASGVVTGWYTGRRAARTALESWHRSRKDSADALAVQAIRELATELARGTHFACWVSWKAKYDPDRLQDSDIERYDAEMHDCLPKLLGAQAALATINASSSDAVGAAVTRVCQLDATIGEACVEWRNGNRLELPALHLETIEVHNEVSQLIRNTSSDVLHREDQPFVPREYPGLSTADLGDGERGSYR